MRANFTEQVSLRMGEMIGASDVLWGGVVPGAVAAIVLAAVWQLTGKGASAGEPHW